MTRVNCIRPTNHYGEWCFEIVDIYKEGGVLLLREVILLVGKLCSDVLAVKIL